ncbi:restriction endonuclease subunit S [Pseudoalteromonas piscicida]|uniref:restriction endonuclease subunit S n=1 Tax=Pseudoalteromonas piscicida TaxID=43662 RepID=UPI0032BF761A
MSVESVITENLDIWTSAIKTKSASGRGSSNKLELYGIKKLRELILDLAIRGNLVHQDRTDEPASILLQRIEEQKSKLVKDKIIKKTKKSPPINTDELFFDIPKNWQWRRLNDVYDVRDGTHDSPKPIEVGYPLVTSKNLSSGKLDLSNVKYISEQDHLKIIQRSNVDRDDILFAMIGSIGNPVIVDIEPNFSIKNVGLFKYYSKEDCNPEFLKYYLIFASKVFKSSSSGGVQPFVSLTKLREFLIPVPPLEEQNRIADKVKELMALCDQLESQTESSIEAHKTLVKTLLATLTNAKDADELNESWQRISEHFDTLFTTEDSIDQLKQTILQLAVMGKLVKQDSNDEPASALLERIAEVKEQLIKDKKIKKQKVLPPISEDDKRFNIPTSWEWTRFGIVALSRLGKMLDKAKNKGELLPYLRNTNVQWRRFELDDLKLMRFEDSELYEFKLKKGDLLICEGGEPGRCAIWNEELNEMYFQKALHRARPFADVLPEYLEVCLTVDCGNGVLEEYFTGATIKHLVGAKLNSYIIPLPPAQEQKRIVDQVSRLTAICNGLKLQLVKSQETQKYLADSISSSLVN